MTSDWIPHQVGGLLSPLLDVVAGCAYLHARQPPLLHRDLKPPNVLYDERKRYASLVEGLTCHLIATQCR